MFATVPAILALASEIISGANTLIQLGKDASPAITLLQSLFSGKQITEAELAAIRTQSDALHDQLQGQTESGQ